MSNERKLWSVFLWTIALSTLLIIIIANSSNEVLLSPGNPSLQSILPLTVAVALVIAGAGELFLRFRRKTPR